MEFSYALVLMAGPKPEGGVVIIYWRAVTIFQKYQMFSYRLYPLEVWSVLSPGSLRKCICWHRLAAAWCPRNTEASHLTLSLFHVHLSSAKMANSFQMTTWKANYWRNPFLETYPKLSNVAFFVGTIKTAWIINKEIDDCTWIELSLFSLFYAQPKQPPLQTRNRYERSHDVMQGLYSQWLVWNSTNLAN